MLTNFFCDKNSLKVIENSEIKESLKKKNAYLWINASRLTKEESKLIEETFEVHPITMEDVLSNQTRTKYEEFEEYTLIIFKTINKTNEDSVDTSNIAFIIGENFIISINEDANETIKDLVKNEKRIESLLRKGEDYVTHYILDKEIDRYLKIKTASGESLKKIEREFTKNQDKETLEKIFSKELLFLELRQLAESVTDLCLSLTKPADNYINNDLIPYFRDIYDHALKTTEGYKTMLGRMNGMKNMYATITSMKTNEVMRSLTIIMALMMPLTIITGFYGMNVKLPFQNNILISLYIFAFMILSAGIMILFSKKRKWISRD